MANAPKDPPKARGTAPYQFCCGHSGTCTYQSNDEANIKRHQRKVHPVNGLKFQCLWCDLKGDRSDNFKRHLLRHDIDAANVKKASEFCDRRPCQRVRGMQEKAVETLALPAPLPRPEYPLLGVVFPLPLPVAPVYAGPQYNLVGVAGAAAQIMPPAAASLLEQRAPVLAQGVPPAQQDFAIAAVDHQPEAVAANLGNAGDERVAEELLGYLNNGGFEQGAGEPNFAPGVGVGEADYGFEQGHLGANLDGGFFEEQIGEDVEPNFGPGSDVGITDGGFWQEYFAANGAGSMAPEDYVLPELPEAPAYQQHLVARAPEDFDLEAFKNFEL